MRVRSACTEKEVSDVILKGPWCWGNGKRGFLTNLHSVHCSPSTGIAHRFFLFRQPSQGRTFLLCRKSLCQPKDEMNERERCAP